MVGTARTGLFCLTIRHSEYCSKMLSDLCWSMGFETQPLSEVGGWGSCVVLSCCLTTTAFAAPALHIVSSPSSPLNKVFISMPREQHIQSCVIDNCFFSCQELFIKCWFWFWKIWMSTSATLWRREGRTQKKHRTWRWRWA